MARVNEVQYVNFYMAGSAAYQLDTLQQKKSPVKLPKAPKQPKLLICLDPLTVIGFVVAFAMIISMTVGLVTLRNVTKEAAVMEQYVQTLKEENAHLEAQYHEGYNLDEIRAYASAMGLIPSDQIQRIQIQMGEPPVAEQETTAWEDFVIFLTGLFA